MDTLNRREFEEEFRRLLESTDDSGNPGSIECQGCRNVMGCTFCRDSEKLVRCHYCVRCVQCADSLHCRDSQNLIHSSHCLASENCITSSYLVRCVGMTDSSYCFGCVGLNGADFHILNQAYERQAYFTLTRRLARELELHW